MDIRFSLRHIGLFAAIARSGSVSAAAARLGMSQSAASTALIELESRYQMHLFDRLGKRLHLSETGRALLPLALNLLDDATAIDRVLRAQAGPGPIAIGATQTIGAYLAPELIATYRQRLPGCPLGLTIANTAAILAGVEDFSLDVGLIEGEPSGIRLMVTEWRDDELVVIVAPDHPLAAYDTCAIDALLAESWVVREQGSGTRQALDRAMTPYRDRWAIELELQQPLAIVELASRTRLIGCVSRLAAQSAIQSGAVVSLAVPALDLRRRFYIVRHREKRPSPAVEALLAICQEAS